MVSKLQRAIRGGRMLARTVRTCAGIDQLAVGLQVPKAAWQELTLAPRRLAAGQPLRLGQRFAPMIRLLVALWFLGMAGLPEIAHAFWLADCAVLTCIPPDNPAAVAGEYDHTVDMYNGCTRIGYVDGGKRNNGQQTYMYEFYEYTAPPYYPWPYSLANHCGSYPGRLLVYTSYCRPGYSSTSDVMPGTFRYLVGPAKCRQPA